MGVQIPHSRLLNSRFEFIWYIISMAKNTTKYSRSQLEEAIADASSQADVIRKLGLRVNNGNYESIRYWALQYDLELPSYDSKNNTRAAIKKNSYTDDEYFVENSRRSGPSTRKRLVSRGVKDECECGQGPVWNGQPLTLQIDHIDGNKFNNKIDNLRIICPNCHTQTKTYANNGTRAVAQYNYCECGKQINKLSARCNSCESKTRIGKTLIEFPPIEDIIAMVKETNWTKAAKEIGCSDNAIRKHLIRNDIDIKTI